MTVPTIIPKSNSNITEQTFLNVLKKKQNISKICSRYNITIEDIQYILYSSSNTIYSLACLIYYKFREHQRKRVNKLYEEIFNSVIHGINLPEQEFIESIIMNNDRLQKYYKVEFSAYNRYLNSLLTNTQCYICREEIETTLKNTNIKMPKNAFTTLECNHCFHICCISEWLKNHNDCPTCRKQVQIYSINDNINENNSNNTNDNNYNINENNINENNINENNINDIDDSGINFSAFDVMYNN